MMVLDKRTGTPLLASTIHGGWVDVAQTGWDPAGWDPVEEESSLVVGADEYTGVVDVYAGIGALTDADVAALPPHHPSPHPHPHPHVHPHHQHHPCCELNLYCDGHHIPHAQRWRMRPGRPRITDPRLAKMQMFTASGEPGLTPLQLQTALEINAQEHAFAGAQRGVWQDVLNKLPNCLCVRAWFCRVPGSPLRHIVSAAECGSWTGDVIDGAFWLAPYTATSAAEIAGFFDSIGNAFKSVGNAIGKAATSVASTVGKLAKDAGKIAEKVVGAPLKVVQGALKVITNNPLWDIARTGVSFIPGIGQAVSAGMAAAQAVGAGASLQDIALKAAKGALPGGKLAELAFDVATGVLLQGKGIDSVALSFVRNQLPGGDLAKKAFDVASGMVMGKHASLGDAVLKAAKGALPNVPIVRAGFEAAAGLAKAKFASPAIINAVQNTLPKIAMPAFSAGLMAAKINKVTPRSVAIMRKVIPPGPARKAVERSVSMAIRTRQVVKVHKDAKSVLTTALTTARRLNAGDPFTRNKVTQIQLKAKKGDRPSTTALALLDVASKTLKAAPGPGARASGEDFYPLTLSPEETALVAGKLGDLLRQGQRLWIGPKPRATRRKLGFAW